MLENLGNSSAYIASVLPPKPVSSSKSDEYFQRKYPMLTPEEIVRIRAPLKAVRQRTIDLIEAHTAWLAKAPSSASRGSGAAVGEFSSLRMDMGRLQHRVAQLQLRTDDQMFSKSV